MGQASGDFIGSASLLVIAIIYGKFLILIHHLKEVKQIRREIIPFT